MFAVSLLLALLTLVASPIPASFRPTHLEITSSWRDPGSDIAPNPHGTVHIACDFRNAAWHCNGGWIEALWIRRLLDAARIPDERGQVRLAGYDNAALERIARTLRTEIRNTPYWTRAERHAALSLATVPSVRSAINRVFFPAAVVGSESRVTLSSINWATVAVRLRDARNHEVRIKSNFKRAKMLPWRISYDGRGVAFAHAALSEAVAALLPPGEENRSWLLQDTPDPGDTLLTDIDFRLIACRYNENPDDRAFCALTRAKIMP